MNLMVKLFCILIFNVFLSTNTFAKLHDVNFDSMRESEVINEIDNMRVKLKEFKEVGEISSASAIAISAVLATITFGIVHSSLVQYFYPDEFLDGISYSSSSYIVPVRKPLLPPRLKGW